MLTSDEIFANLTADYERIALVSKFKEYINQLDDTDEDMLPVIKAANLMLEAHLRAKECKETVMFAVTQILMCALCNGYLGHIIVEIMDLNNKHMYETIQSVLSEAVDGMVESKGKVKQ